jgi:parvulin-like peptidyl-prolyl isomerase
MTKETQVTRGPTRRQIAYSKREREQLRLIYIGLGVVGGLSLLVLLYGLLQTYVLEPQAPVAIVNGAEITTSDYRHRVLYERFILDAQLSQLQQQRETTAAQAQQDEQITELLLQQYDQYIAQLSQQRQVVDLDTLELMIDDKLLEAEAQKRGLTVSAEEVTEQINQFLASQAGGVTAAAAEQTVTAQAEAALWTPTPTPTSPVITPSTVVTGPTITPTNTPLPIPTPTVNIIPVPTLTSQHQTWMETLGQIGLDEAAYRQIAQTFVIRQKVREAIITAAPRVVEQAHARHILVETEAEAQAIVKRLQQGESFAALAAELSLDRRSAAQGGDLDFVARGVFVKPVDEAIFSMPISETKVVESDFGWHIIELLAREERELSPAAYNQSQNTMFTTWLEEARAGADIQNLWTTDKAPKDALYR